MTRISRFTAFFPGLCLARIALANEPGSTPPAKSKQVQQTVEIAIKYLRRESAD
jgi:hypothetical protein